MVEITDDRIAELKAEAEAARNEDFRYGYEAGNNWVTHADYTELQTARVHAVQASYIMLSDAAAEEAKRIAEDLGADPEEFLDDVLGYHSTTQDFNSLLAGFYKAVTEYIEVLEQRGVHFPR